MTVLMFHAAPREERRGDALREIFRKYSSGEFVELYVVAVTSDGEVESFEVREPQIPPRPVRLL